jgi:hypothetical protein
MQAHGDGEGFALAHTVDGYPWAELGEATVVDVGHLNIKLPTLVIIIG